MARNNCLKWQGEVPRAAIKSDDIEPQLDGVHLPSWEIRNPQSAIERQVFGATFSVV